MFQLTAISLSIFIAAVVNIFTAYVSWQRRKTKGGIYFAVAMMGVAFWSLAAALDYAAVPIPLKVFFAKLEYLGYHPALGLMTAFSFVYAGHEERLKDLRVRALLILVPAFGVLLAWTNEWHGLLWAGFTPIKGGSNVVHFEHGPGFVWMAMSGYLLVLIMGANLLQVAITGNALLRRQARLMLSALLVPVASNLLYLFDAFNIPGVDWSSITFSIAGVIFLIALYGSRFMEIIPTARNTLIEQMNDGVLVIDQQARLVDFNPAARATCRLSNDDLWKPLADTRLKNFSEIVSLLTDPSGKTIRDIRIGEKSFNIQRIPLADARGAVYGQLAVMRDISERFHFEEILRRRNDTLAALNQAMLDLVNRLEVDDILQTLLTRAQALLDAPDVSVDLIEDENVIVTYAVTPGQPLQKGDRMRRGEGGWLSWQAIDSKESITLDDYASWSQRRHQFDAHPTHAMMIAPIIQRGQVIGSVNYSRTREGYPFSETDVNLGKQLAQIVSLMLDNSQVYLQLRNELAERKQMQEELRISQENFMGYFNTGTVGMSVTTPGRVWVEVNDQLCRMLGYSKEELKQLTWSELTHPDDLNSDIDFFNQAIRGERDTYQIDKRFIRRDGGILHVSLSVSCQRFPDGSPCYFLASLMDISERVQQEAALRAALEQLAEQRRTVAVIEERQRLARDLHDSVSQSLHSLNLFSETLTSSLAKPNRERTLQLAERLQETARQALKEARLMLYQLQPSELEAEADLIQEIEARLSSVEERAGVRAALKVEGDAGLCPLEWRENLFRITIEALNNSLKHAQARNVQVTLHYGASAVEINVTDDGIGFDRQRARTGGMGMRTMRERADLLGGTLEMRSAPGAGTSVIVRVEKKEMP
jgi:PAS domain S-box-containing protein